MSPVTVLELSAATVSAMSPRSELLEGPKEGPNWTIIGIIILVGFVILCFTLAYFWHRYQGNKAAKRIAKREQEAFDREIGLHQLLSNTDAARARQAEEGRSGWRGVDNALHAHLAETQRENDRMYAEGINPYGESTPAPASIPASSVPSSSRLGGRTPAETRFPVIPTPPAASSSSAAPAQSVSNGRRSKFEEHFDERYDAKYSNRLASQFPTRKPVPRPRISEDASRLSLAERRGLATPSTPTPKSRSSRRRGPTTKSSKLITQIGLGSGFDIWAGDLAL